MSTENRIIGNRFELVKEIATRSSCKVYLAKDNQLGGIDVAVKLFTEAASSSVEKLFNDELAALKNVSSISSSIISRSHLSGQSQSNSAIGLNRTQFKNQFVQVQTEYMRFQPRNALGERLWHVENIRGHGEVRRTQRLSESIICLRSS